MPDKWKDVSQGQIQQRKRGRSFRYWSTPSPGAFASPGAGKWLIAPRPNPGAKARLFCFPYAGGGLVSFRTWAQLFDDTVEIVAIEAPGRGTRINEPAVDDLDTFVERLLPEMSDWLDRPSAFFGHCLGGLTMFATLRALPDASSRFVKHAFACGVRPPHLLKRKGEFEDNLIYDMMLHGAFDIKLPLYAQTDEIFVEFIRQFDTPAANKMLEIPKLRNVLLPTIRAEFAMAYNYQHQPVEPFPCPDQQFRRRHGPVGFGKRLRWLGRVHTRRVHQPCAQRFPFFDGGGRRLHHRDNQS